MSQPLEPARGSLTLAPVAPEERIALLDVLRGFALLGILIMNMPGFNTPWESWALEPRLFPGVVDRVATFVMDLFVSGKANSTFSFLFGLGFTIQMQRAEARGGSFVLVYLRRLAFLFVVGAAHGLLVWSGDVLHVYAVLGLMLLAVRRAPDKLIFALIGLFLVAPMARQAWAFYFNEPWVPPMPVVIARAHDHMRIFQQGTYMQQLGVRVQDWSEGYGLITRLWGMIWGYATFAVTILLGFYAGRKRVFENIEANTWIRKATWWCLGAGFAAAGGFAVVMALYKPTGQNSLTEFFIRCLYSLNRPVLCLAYIGLIAILFQKERFRRVLSRLTNVGRMPLTNYLMQSLIATTLFNSYGLGLFGKVGPALGLVFTAVIFAAQVAYSDWWMARFQYGPLEWLWRGATYGKLPVLRKGARPQAEIAPA